MDHLLKKERSERNVPQSFQAIADRIKGCRVYSAEIGGRGCSVQQRLHGRGYAPRQSDFHKNKRLFGKGRVKECEAASIVLQPSSQIGPAIDLVNGLVLNQPFEDDGGCSPIDPSQLQKPSVEPGREQVNQVQVDRFELGLTREQSQ